MIRTLLLVYLALLHGLLGMALWKTDLAARVFTTVGFYSAARLVQPELGAYYRTMRGQLARVDINTGPGSVLFVGDSIVQQMNVADVTSRAVNHGIGGDTVRGVAARLPALRALATARAVVLDVGINDLGRRDVDLVAEELGALLRLPVLTRLPVLLLGPLPLATENRFGLDPAAAVALGERYAEYCRVLPNCTYIDVVALLGGASVLAPVYDAGDGLHPSAAAYRRLKQRLRTELNSL